MNVMNDALTMMKMMKDDPTIKMMLIREI